MGRHSNSRKELWNAIGEQIEYLRRYSRLHVRGIKVGIDEPAKGFAQSEDVVVSIYIPYCEAGSEWEVVIDGENPERCPDLVPMPVTEAEVGKGFTSGLLETYDLYRLSNLGSLKKWDLFRRPESLLTLALDIRRLRREHEIKKLANSPIKSAYFQFEAVRDREYEVEVLVSRSGVRIVFPLWKNPKDEGEKGEEPDPTTELGLMFVYGRAGIRVRLEWTEVDGKRPDVRFIFPSEAQGLARSFRQPSWTSEMTLYDYIPQAQAAVERPWLERKLLVASFAARHSVLEYDAQDFTLLHLFMKVKVDNFVHLRILRLDIGPDYPQYPPQMTLCDALSDKSWTLDRRGYLYSPRWDPERMVTELYKHAVNEVAKIVPI